MKKIILLSIIFATIAIIGCSKKDNPTSNNNLPEDETLSTKETHHGPTSACFYWRHPGHTEEDCVNGSILGELCYIRVGCESEFSFLIYYDVNPVDSLVTTLYIPISSVPQGIGNWLSQQVLTGSITFNYDCPIDNPNVLNLCSNDYIPAGTYSLSSNNEYYKITLN